MNHIFVLGQLIFFYAARIHASDLLAIVNSVHIEEDNELIEFTELYNNFSANYVALYKAYKTIYELRAVHSTRKDVSVVFKFNVTDIPIVTPGRIVLKGNFYRDPVQVILHCTLTAENARKIFVDYLPTGIRRFPQYRLTNLWKIAGKDQHPVTDKAVGIFIDYLPNDRLRQRFSIESIEGDGQPYVVFSTMSFGAMMYRESTLTKVIVVIDELRKNDQMKHHYAFELETEQGDSLAPIILNAASYRTDLSRKIPKNNLFS